MHTQTHIRFYVIGIYSVRCLDNYRIHTILMYDNDYIDNVFMWKLRTPSFSFRKVETLFYQRITTNGVNGCKRQQYSNVHIVLEIWKTITFFNSWYLFVKTERIFFSLPRFVIFRFPTIIRFPILLEFYEYWNNENYWCI